MTICKYCQRKKATDEQYATLLGGARPDLCWSDWDDSECDLFRDLFYSVEALNGFNFNKERIKKAINVWLK